MTSTATLEVERSINFGDLIRAIDVVGSKALIGLRNGTIYNLDIPNESKDVVMESHSEGELWGMCSMDDSHIITTADDNKIKLWNISTRKCEATSIISHEKRQAPKGGASTLSHLPAS